MTYVLHILAALLSLGLDELGLTSGADRPWLLPLLVVAPYAIAWATRRRLVRGKFRSAMALERALGIVPVLGQILAVAVCGWTTSIERWWGIEASLALWPGLGLLLGVLPFVVIQWCVIDARARLNEADAHRRRTLRSFHVRMFASAFSPFLLFVGVSTAIALYEPLRVSVEEVALYNTLYVGVLIAGFVLLVPRVLERTWETEALEPGWARDVLEGVSRKAGFRCREILVWRTGHHMANAAIVGFTPRSRIVLFSDALLAHLDPRQLAAVFAHEIGHAKGRHPLVFAAYAVVLFLGGDLVLGELPLESEAAAIGVFVGLFALWLFVFGLASRRFELEADLVSMEIVGDAQPLVEALEKLGGGSARQKSSWRHFSTEQRVRFLERAAQDPAAARRLRRALRAWKIGGLVLLLGVLGGQGYRLWGGLDVDRVDVDLRLGRYEAAALRIEAGVEVDASIARLVERGRRLDDDRRSPDALEAAARTAWEERNGRASRELLELAILRGRKELLVVLEAAAILAGSDEETPARALTEAEVSALPDSWQALLGFPDPDRLP